MNIVTAMRQSRLRSAVLLLSLAIVVMAGPVAAQDTKAIVVIHSYGQDAPGRPPFDAAFARTVREASGVTVELYVETIDPNRFGGERQAQLTRDYLRERYAGKNIAALAVVYDSALAFVLDEREPLFPGVPIAALLTRNPPSLADRVTVITSGSTIGKSAALALQLNPRATRIAVIDGAPPNAGRNAVGAEVRDQLQALGLGLPVTFLTDLPLDELIVQLQALPPETIILMVSQYIGRGGEPIAQGDAARELARAARAPIYVLRDQLIGSGALGGVVMTVENAATDLAKLALRISVDGARRLPSTQAAAVSMFDWRELRRWGISETLLPAGSVVQFRPLSAWDQYKHYILATIAIMALQSALIAGLVVQRARRRRTERALRESERRFRLMADTAPVLIWRSRIDKTYDFFNKPWLDFRGRTHEQECDSGRTEGVHPDDLAECLRVYDSAFDARAPFNMEYRLRRADGEYRWILDTGVARRDEDGHFAGYIGSALDITARKGVEEQNQDLAGRLITAQEAERTRIARDLHDDVSQQLASVSILLSGLKDIVGTPDSRPDVDDTIAMLEDRTITLSRTVRDLSHQLHSSVLEHVGLVAALHRLCDEIQRHHLITVTFTAGDHLDALDPAVALCLFRVSQEALTNAVRHASPRTISVQLLATPDRFELSIIDDGVGFVISPRGGDGLGLRSVRERVRFIRGHVTIESQPGCGTRLLVQVPRTTEEVARVGSRLTSSRHPD